MRRRRVLYGRWGWTGGEGGRHSRFGVGLRPQQAQAAARQRSKRGKRQTWLCSSKLLPGTTLLCKHVFVAGVAIALVMAMIAMHKPRAGVFVR
jgi:hypothetical protein